MRSASPDAVITSNGDDAMGWQLNREIQPIPKLINPRTKRKNISFKEEFDTLYCQLKNSDGYLVYFNIIDWRSYLPTLENIQQNYPFVVVKQTYDGVVLKTNKDDASPFCLP